MNSIVLFPKGKEPVSRTHLTATNNIQKDLGIVKVFTRKENRRQRFEQNYFGFYSPSENVISLFQSANQFTFMHESAHMYLSTLSQLAANGSKEAQAELDTILSWAKYSPAAMADYAGTKLESDLVESEKKIKGTSKNSIPSFFIMA